MYYINKNWSSFRIPKEPLWGNYIFSSMRTHKIWCFEIDVAPRSG